MEEADWDYSKLIEVVEVNMVEIKGISITAHYDYEIWQMDVKTAFLNGNLEEEIYMMQLESFIEKNQEHMVCKSKRSIYGLKQASRSLNIKFDQAISHLVLNKILMNHVCTIDIKTK